MFIAHLPAAYIAFKAGARRISKPAFAAGMLGAVFPDLDMFWFYFIDHKAHHHHDYITHRPFVWICITVIGFALYRYRCSAVVTAFGVGGLIHMLLDTTLGAVNWAWPFGDWGGPVIIVPATHDHWIASFVTHWTFWPEIIICVVAAIVYARSRRT
ncbi:MAG: metal-dependent hydrolase [Pacificibacter sp.]|uniref:metal-dependent hydrolase n=1 Tax=Pacificibacter sp. TaxID=1917866 RepID=UPI00321B8E2C